MDNEEYSNLAWTVDVCRFSVEKIAIVFNPLFFSLLRVLMQLFSPIPRFTGFGCELSLGDLNTRLASSPDFTFFNLGYE